MTGGEPAALMRTGPWRRETVVIAHYRTPLGDPRRYRRYRKLLLSELLAALERWENPSMAGIKESSDVVRAVGAALAVYEQAAADGLGLDDVSRLLNDEFMDRVAAAFDGISEVPTELADLSWGEIIRLVQTVATSLR